MFKQLIIFLSLFTRSNSFVLSPQVYRESNLVLTSRNKNNYMSPVLVINNIPPPPSGEDLTLLDHFLDITIRDKYLGKIIVETISAQLPNVDSIGHNVLRANNEFINTILNNPTLSEPVKKMIVLASIKLAIMGDNMGSTLLQLYYDIVDKCL